MRLNVNSDTIISPTKIEKGIETSRPPPQLSKKFAPENTQSQTLRGDSPHDEFEYPHLRELEDLDNKEIYRSSRKKEKEPIRDKSKSRRYTIELGEYEDEFVLSRDLEAVGEEVEGSETLFEKVQTSTHFINSVSLHPEE